MSESTAAATAAIGTAGGQCAICAVDAALKCTACKVTFYCGAEHQRQHWKAHKPLCQRPFASDGTDGVVATRDICARSVIFVEAPLAVGPKWTVDEELERADLFPCVGCFRPVHLSGGSVAERCPGCAWPACSPECAGLNDPQRHAIECAVLSMDRPAKSRYDDYRSDALLALRCVLLQLKYPQRWAQLLQLHAHEEQRKDNANYEEADERIVSYLKSRFFDRFVQAIAAAVTATSQPQLDCDTATLHRVCGIIESNALNVTLEHQLEIGGVYAEASRLEHSCMPNCLYNIEPAGQLRLTMLAGRDIRSGERLSVMRTHMLWGTQMRHEHLLASRYVVCACARCTDPTELGTYVSALRCIGDENAECAAGRMLPVDAQDPATEWRCDACPMRCDNEQIAFVLANIADEVDGLLLRRETVTVTEVETLIGKLTQLLHPQHYHLVALRHSMVQMYGSHKGYEAHRLSVEQLRTKVDMCEELLRLLDVLDPHAIRLALYIGIVLYEMHAAVVELERRRQREALAEGVRYDYEGLYVAEGYLVRAKQVLENGGETSQGRKMVESVVRASEELEKLFEGIKV